jgi:hypothetical protein
MIPYFIVFLIGVLFAVLDLFAANKNLKIAMILTYGFIIIIFAGLRWETGTDWENYLTALTNVQNVDYGQSGYEFGYELLLRFASSLSNKYTLVLFITAIFIYSFTSGLLKKYSPYPLFSLLLLLSYSLNASGFGYRQDLAIALTFFSFHFIVEKKLIWYLFFIFLAIMFHQSAIIFLPAFWIARINWNKKSLFILISFIVLIKVLIWQLSQIVPIFSAMAASKVEIYSDLTPEEKNMNLGDPFLILFRGLLNRSILILPPLILMYKKRDNLIFRGSFNLVLMGIVLFVIFHPLGAVFLRFTRYYDIFHIILISLMLSFSKANFKILLFILYLLYCVFKFSYVLITDDNVYVPYQTIF